VIDERKLFERVSAIIENIKHRAQVQMNQESVIMFQEVGQSSALFCLEASAPHTEGELSGRLSNNYKKKMETPSTTPTSRG
jgi:hypothetical protein